MNSNLTNLVSIC